uniref:Ig-like domain-containing protein n=1 Tax=Podarcis muralis TaxID=64176 RepID=A0A670JUQ5_PODMU
LTVMASFLFLLALFFYCSGKSICTQPASESVLPGQSIKLSCTTSDTGSAVRWFQQRSGQVPRFVHCESCSKGEGIPDRFTASRSGTVGYLTITNVQVEDEAVYYCCRWYSSVNGFHSDWYLGLHTLQVTDSRNPEIVPRKSCSGGMAAAGGPNYLKCCFRLRTVSG